MMSNKAIAGVTAAVLGISLSLFLNYLMGTSRASEEDWTEKAQAHCEEKQGYLIYLHKANEPTSEVLCIPVIFREKAP